MKRTIFLSSVAVFILMQMFQISLRGAYALHVPHLIVSLKCGQRVWTLVW